MEEGSWSQREEGDVAVFMLTSHSNQVAVNPTSARLLRHWSKTKGNANARELRCSRPIVVKMADRPAHHSHVTAGFLGGGGDYEKIRLKNLKLNW